MVETDRLTCSPTPSCTVPAQVMYDAVEVYALFAGSQSATSVCAVTRVRDVAKSVLMVQFALPGGITTIAPAVSESLAHCCWYCWSPHPGTATSIQLSLCEGIQGSLPALLKTWLQSSGLFKLLQSAGGSYFAVCSVRVSCNVT